LAHGTPLAAPLVAEVQRLLLDHLQDHYAFYGEYLGVRTARKHIGWYLKGLPGAVQLRADINLIEDSAAQMAALKNYFEQLGQETDRLPAVSLGAQNTEQATETVG
jgi:tRNA-dihydrouridine synthase B